VKSKEKIKLSDIKINPKNPRLIRDKKFQSLVESIKRDPEFLEKRGIVHANGIILGGNQRYMAIKEALKIMYFGNRWDWRKIQFQSLGCRMLLTGRRQSGSVL